MMTTQKHFFCFTVLRTLLTFFKKFKYLCVYVHIYNYYIGYWFIGSAHIKCLVLNHGKVQIGLGAPHTPINFDAILIKS